MAAATLFSFSDEASTTISSGGTTAPSAGTVETWTAASSAQFPAASNLSSPNQSFAISDPAVPTEVMLVTNITGVTWTVIRGAEGTTPIAHTAGFTVNAVISSTPLNQQFSTVQVPDFVIFSQFGQFYAKRGWTGENAYVSATDAGVVLQSAISELAAEGSGSVWFQTGVYNWQTIPAIPAGLANWLRIAAEPGTTITLTSSGARFLDFNKTANGQTFSFVWIEGFTIDCSSVATSLTGGSHVICGTYHGGVSPVTSGTDVNFDHIRVRDCRVINGFAGPTSTAFQKAIDLSIYQDSAGLATNTITNVEISSLEVQGCSYAISISGDKNGTWTGELAMLIDKIRIENVHHDLGAAATAADDYNTIRIGYHAPVGTVWVQDVWSNGSAGDVVEIDNALDAKILNVWCENAFGFAIAATNYAAPADLNQQVYDIQNVSYMRTAGGWGPLSGVLGLPLNTNYSAVNQAFGHIRIRDIKMYVNATGLSDIVSSPINGDLLNVDAAALEIFFANAYYYATGYNQTSTTTAAVPTVLNVAPPVATTAGRLTFDSIDIQMNGTNAAGAVAATPLLIPLSGNWVIDIDNVSASVNFTNPSTSTACIIMEFGFVTTYVNVFSGMVDHFKVNPSNGTALRGIRFRASANLAIAGSLVIRDSDFSGLPSAGNDLNFGSTVTQASVFTYGCRWQAFPRPEYTLAVPASGTATQFLETFCSPATLAINGGTVTVISQGRTATTHQAAAATNTAIQLNNGDFFALTYSVAPTITVIPDN